MHDGGETSEKSPFWRTQTSTERFELSYSRRRPCNFSHMECKVFSCRTTPTCEHHGVGVKMSCQIHPSSTSTHPRALILYHCFVLWMWTTAFCCDVDGVCVCGRGHVQPPRFRKIDFWDPKERRWASQLYSDCRTNRHLYLHEAFSVQKCRFGAEILSYRRSAFQAFGLSWRTHERLFVGLYYSTLSPISYKIFRRCEWGLAPKSDRRACALCLKSAVCRNVRQGHGQPNSCKVALLDHCRVFSFVIRRASRTILFAHLIVKDVVLGQVLLLGRQVSSSKCSLLGVKKVPLNFQTKLWMMTTWASAPDQKSLQDWIIWSLDVIAAWGSGREITKLSTNDDLVIYSPEDALEPSGTVGFYMTKKTWRP